MSTQRTTARQLREELALTDQLAGAGLRFPSAAARRAFVRRLLPLSPARRRELIEERHATQAGGPAPRPPQDPDAQANWLRG